MSRMLLTDNPHTHTCNCIGRMSNYRQLLLLCVKALSTFNPELTGVDNHLESFLQSPESNVS